MVFSFHSSSCHFGKCEFLCWGSLFLWNDRRELLFQIEECGIICGMHYPELVSRAPVILFPLNSFFAGSCQWGEHFFHFNFLLNMSKGSAGVFGDSVLGLGQFKLFYFGSESDNLFLPLGMCPPSAEQAKMCCKSLMLGNFKPLKTVSLVLHFSLLSTLCGSPCSHQFFSTVSTLS
jgi:hypothetical protein